MKSFNELKKVLIIGKKLRVVHHATRPDCVGELREVRKTQSNGFWTAVPGEVREFWLEFPVSSKLVEYSENKFAFYDIGKRDLTAKERKVLEECNEYCGNHPYENIYYSRLSIAKKYNAEYLITEKNHKRYSYSEKMVYDPQVKGEKFIEFEFVEEV